MRQVPHEGKIYAFNEGNYEGWETGLREYMDSLKNASKWGGKPYSARRAPALVTSISPSCCLVSIRTLRLSFSGSCMWLLHTCCQGLETAMVFQCQG